MRRLAPLLGAALLCGVHACIGAQELPMPEVVEIDGFEVVMPDAPAPGYLPECVWPDDDASPCAESGPGDDASPGQAHGRGVASWYGPRFHGRRTASGERFDQHALTAAHPTLPFGTRVRVESTDGRAVEVRINDRGPHIKQRVIDLSRAAAQALGMLDAGGGLKEVILRVIKAPGR